MVPMTALSLVIPIETRPANCGLVWRKALRKRVLAHLSIHERLLSCSAPACLQDLRCSLSTSRNLIETTGKSERWSA